MLYQEILFIVWLIVTVVQAFVSGWCWAEWRIERRMRNERAEERYPGIEEAAEEYANSPDAYESYDEPVESVRRVYQRKDGCSQDDVFCSTP